MLHPTMPPPTMTTRVRVGRWEFTLGPDLTRQHFFHNALIRGVTHRALGGRIRPVSFSVYRVPSDAGEHSFAARPRQTPVHAGAVDNEPRGEDDHRSEEH